MRSSVPETWTGTYVDDGKGYKCEMGITPKFYGQQTWVQNSSGFFDIYGAFEYDLYFFIILILLYYFYM